MSLIKKCCKQLVRHFWERLTSPSVFTKFHYARISQKELGSTTTSTNHHSSVLICQYTTLDNHTLTTTHCNQLYLAYPFGSTEYHVVCCGVWQWIQDFNPYIKACMIICLEVCLYHIINQTRYAKFGHSMCQMSYHIKLSFLSLPQIFFPTLDFNDCFIACYLRMPVKICIKKDRITRNNLYQTIPHHFAASKCLASKIKCAPYITTSLKESCSISWAYFFLLLVLFRF